MNTLKVPCVLVALGLVGALAGCAVDSTATEADGGKAKVVATTSILADIVSNVAGDAAQVTGLIPPGADAHSYELGLRAVRDIAYADVVFTNGLLLEPQRLIRTVDTTAPEGTRVVPVAEQAERHGFQPRLLVEDAGLDAPWLGLRVAVPEQDKAVVPKTAVADIALKEVAGPGEMAAYIVGTFGTPELLFNSADGLDGKDETTLPIDAHTHVSWAFSKPGVYTVTVGATARADINAEPTPLKDQTFTIAVGVNPHEVLPGADVLNGGHVDITAEFGADYHGAVGLVGDGPDGASISHAYDRAVIAVPSATLQEVPAGREYRFLGNPGEETYLLPQAVLGKHVHGEFDPHFWHDVEAVKAVVKVVRDELSAADPSHSAQYNTNAESYLAELDRLNDDVKEALAQIPQDHRNLVTTHDGYGYLADAYGLNLAGYITPNPSVEPSPRDIIALTRTLENLGVPAVFLEPGAESAPSELEEIAGRLGVAVCTIRGDALDPPGTGNAHSYIEFMRANAHSLTSCLSASGSGLRTPKPEKKEEP
ncbi:anchored repeat ABC transporter, substrate-binding protein [Corynebacterium tuscaniense]|uniref:anchored repeat ABC transporter, substrate-binding protein n=1 Tax=Corynebacterium tuscaniense TaxID=302449 RepID=UPI0009FC5B9D|nr:anchored repeat ABC transporter, substrate-binding protein [Corynebacterium tuscaniense]